MNAAMRPRWRSWLSGWVVALAGICAHAADAPAVAPDPALEARVVALSLELRCLVCQNQTIADSHAGLAVDLKNQIREQIKAGRSDRQILDYMVERYGDFVLYRPPVKATTALLWYGPFVLLAVGAVIGVVVVRRRQSGAMEQDTISEEQKRRAAAMLADQQEGKA